MRGQEAIGPSVRPAGGTASGAEKHLQLTTFHRVHSPALHSDLGSPGNLSRALPSITDQLHVWSACSSLCSRPTTLFPQAPKRDSI